MATQDERRATTRRALLDATVGSLVDHGCTGTTTTVVVARAGVSQGALFKHFPTKADLLAETARHVYAQLVERYLDRFSTVDPARPLAERVEASLHLLWEMFASPTYAAALELTVAARTDRGLARRLAPVVAEHATRIRALAAALFPELAARPGHDVTLDLVLETMTGMATGLPTDTDAAHYDRLVELLVELTLERLAAPASARPRRASRPAAARASNRTTAARPPARPGSPSTTPARRTR